MFFRELSELCFLFKHAKKIYLTFGVHIDTASVYQSITIPVMGFRNIILSNVNPGLINHGSLISGVLLQ